MTQTMNGPDNSAQKRGKPGQRQQERLQRRVRRRRRIVIWTSTIIALTIIIASIVGLLQYQRVTADQQAAADKIKNQHATATASVFAGQTAVVEQTASAQASATAAIANATATASAGVEATAVAKAQQALTAGSPTPTAGAASPPEVTGKEVTLDGGLKYIDIKEGTGAVAKEGSTVYVLYTGWLQSTGKEFDSSYDHGGQTFPVTPLGQAQIIPGWNKGLIGIKAGGTRRLIIPPELAYGAQGSPPKIPANATLIFDVTAVYVK